MRCILGRYLAPRSGPRCRNRTRPFVVGTGAGRSPVPETHEEPTMTATYTYDVFASLDGFGSYDEPGDWGGYWGKQGPDLIARRSALFDQAQRMVFGADTFRQFVEML